MSTSPLLIAFNYLLRSCQLFSVNCRM